MSTPESYPAEFNRIEAAVDAGETDLRALGFWRLLARVKADAALSHHWAEQAGRIDRTAFEAHVRPRFPVWFGNLVLLLGAVAGAFAAGIAIGTTSETLAGLLLLFAAGAWTVAFHSPVHWLVGRMAGIRFTCYFFGGPFPPRPGLKIDYATYLSAAPGARAWMHASGAIATKLAPFVALAIWPATEAPAWAAWVLVAVAALLIANDIVFSTRSSDWKRVRRERRVARLQAAGR